MLLKKEEKLMNNQTPFKIEVKMLKIDADEAIKKL